MITIEIGSFQKYRLPHFIRESFPLENVDDLLNAHFLNICYKESKDCFHCGMIAAPALEGKLAVVINDIDWCLSDRSNPIISIPYSLAPSQCRFCRLLSDFGGIDSDLGGLGEIMRRWGAFRGYVGLWGVIGLFWGINGYLGRDERLGERLRGAEELLGGVLEY